MSQLTLNFEPALPERFASLRAYVAHRATVQAKPMKTIAADMDLSPSALSRKLNPAEQDTARFTLDDLEAYLDSTGDAAAVIEYVAAKFMAGGDVARKARVVANAEQLLKDLQRALAALQT